MSAAIQTHLSPLWHTCGKREPAIYFITPPLERMVESRYFYAGLCTKNLFPPNHACVAAILRRKMCNNKTIDIPIHFS